jgi:putative thiamine transport system permease protein
MAGDKFSRLQSALGSLPLTILLIVPLAASLLFILPSLLDFGGFVALYDHPQFWGSLQLTLSTGLASTVLALLLAIAIVGQNKTASTLSQAGTLLALPHLAFAIGLGFLVAPTGLLARLIATLVTGWTSPPPWQTVQDAHGIGLTVALVLKETPFIVWAMASVQGREDVKQGFQGQRIAARSLGHGEWSIWLKILLPQILPRMIWPLVAVFSYGMTVVDMALVIGPGQPPTLANLIWTDLNDGEVLANSRGAAGVLVLTCVIIALLQAAAVLARVSRPLRHRYYSAASGKYPDFDVPFPLWTTVKLLYAAVFVALAIQSVSGYWPFPQVWADQYSLKAWARLLLDGRPLLTSLLLAMATTTAGLLSCVIWFETLSEKHDRLVLAACALSLCIPPLLIALGQYRLLLQLGLTGTVTGLFMAHVLPVTAYVFVMLQGPCRGFDPRWQQVSDGVAASRLDFLLHVKLPLLKGPLLASAAVGFAVSMAQFVTAQLAAAGRFSTLPMEAVTLASGSNRPLFATYALALMLLPLLAFLLAGILSRSRWSMA